jgi:hypothetical protein
MSSDSVSEKSDLKKNRKMKFANYVEKFTDRIDLKMDIEYEEEKNKYKDRRLKI